MAPLTTSPSQPCKSGMPNGNRLLCCNTMLPSRQPDDPRLAPARNAVTATPTHNAPDPVRRDYQRLRFSAEEAAGISAQFAPADVDELIGVDATRERLLALDWSQYRFIHIATHGIVDTQVPELSALILGSYDARGAVADRAVRVADVSLQTLTAEVAVLSACETALGTQIRGEGLVGMSSTMLTRGARAVVASLWAVPDEIGARLMTEFYQHMLHDSMGPEEALGAAMRSMALRERSSDPPPCDSEDRHHDTSAAIAPLTALPRCAIRGADDSPAAR